MFAFQSHYPFVSEGKDIYENETTKYFLINFINKDKKAPKVGQLAVFQEISFGKLFYFAG